MGEALKQLAEVKFALEDNVKQNFLEPLTQLQNKEVRDVLVSVLSLMERVSFVPVFCCVFRNNSFIGRNLKVGVWTLIAKKEQKQALLQLRKISEQRKKSLRSHLILPQWECLTCCPMKQSKYLNWQPFLKLFTSTIHNVLVFWKLSQQGSFNSKYETNFL